MEKTLFSIMFWKNSQVTHHFLDGFFFTDFFMAFMAFFAFSGFSTNLGGW